MRAERLGMESADAEREINRQVSDGLLALLHQHHGYRVTPPPPVKIIPITAEKEKEWRARHRETELERRRKISRWEQGWRRTLMARSGPTMAEIARATAAKYDMDVHMLRSRQKTSLIVRPRQEAIYRCCTETTHSLPEIGNFFGRDHTTIMAARDAHARRMGLL